MAFTALRIVIAGDSPGNARPKRLAIARVSGHRCRNASALAQAHLDGFSPNIGIGAWSSSCGRAGRPTSARAVRHVHQAHGVARVHLAGGSDAP